MNSRNPVRPGARQEHANILAYSPVRPEAHPLLASYQRALRRQNLAPNTIAQYLDCCRQFLAYAQEHGFPDVTQVRREHVEMWEISLRDAGRSPHTVRGRFLGLRLWLRWLVEEGELARDPTERMPMPKVEEVDKDVLAVAEIAAVIRDMETEAKKRGAPILVVRNLAIVSLFYGTGARVTEVCQARIEDLNMDAGTLFFRPSTTKAGRGRLVGLGPVMVSRLDRYLRKRRDILPWLFLGRGDKALTRTGVYQLVREAFAGTGKAIGPHDLRHTSASHAAGSMGESEMMDAYGWKDSAMARHYTRQVRQEIAAEAQRRASPLERL